MREGDRRCVACQLVILCGVCLLLGCDRKMVNAPSAPAAQQVPPASPPAVTTPAKPDDPVAEFKRFASVFVDELDKESHAKEKGTTTRVYDKNSTAIDVRKTDSLISPILGMVTIKQVAVLNRYGKNGKSEASTNATATDTFNFSLDGKMWKYINGRSVGQVMRVDPLTASSRNPLGVTQANFDDDLTNDPRIVKVMAAATKKVADK